MRRASLGFAVLAVGCFGQPPPAAAPAAFKLGKVTVTGSFRSRTESWNWFQPDSGDNDYAYSGNILRVGLSQSLERWDWNAEFAAPFLLGLPENPIGPGTQGQLGLGANYLVANNRNRNAAMVFPKQLFLRWKQAGGNRAHSLRVGRFEFLDGSEMTPKNTSLAALKRDRINQRLLGAFGWAHVGRSFDGAQYVYARPSGVFTAMGAVPTRGVFQVDGWGWNQAAFGYASYTRPWGRKAHAAETRFFALSYDDWRGVLKTDNRSLAARRGDAANIRIETWGGHSLHAVETRGASLDVVLWAAAQTGHWGVESHRAFAVDVEAGIQPKSLRRLKPWLRGGFYDGSGDGNANDDRHETFFQVLPTPRPFARFPFFNMMNSRDRFAILILRPHPKVTVSSEFHALRLSNSQDLWYTGGGVFQPWTFGYAGRAVNGGRSLANLYDTSLEYRVHPRIMMTAYFGYAQGRAIASAIYPQGKNGQFGYLEALYRFW